MFKLHTTDTKIAPGQSATIKASSDKSHTPRKLRVDPEVAQHFALHKLDVAGAVVDFPNGEPLLNYIDCVIGRREVPMRTEVSVTVRNISEEPQAFAAELTDGR